MNLLGLLLILLPALGWAQSNPEIVLNKGTVIVAGKIENASQGTMTIISLELMGRESHLIRINKDGSFKATFEILSPHSNYLSYDRKLITFFAEAGDSLYIEADGQDFKKSVEFFGDKTKTNQCIRSFYQVFAETRNSVDLFTKKLKAPLEEFLSALNEVSASMPMKIDSIYQTFGAEDIALQWMESYVKYKIADEMLDYGRFHKDDLPDDYYSFVDEYKAELNDLICPEFYESYMNHLYEGHQYRLLADQYQEYSGLVEQGKVSQGLRKYFEVVDNNVEDQIAKDLILTRICNDYIRDDFKSVDSVYSNFRDIVSTRDYHYFIRNQLIEKRQGNESVSTLDDLANLEFIGDLFSEIRKEYPNKVLYIDLWGPWCKPCLNEFPHSKNLYASFKNQPIEFVYLGCKSDKETWQKFIDRFELKGTHYLLTEDQFNVFTGQFNLIGFPRYMIIDQDGVIVDDDADRPSHEGLSAQLLGLIE
ncbi:MAG: TlpA disulfide reductase family protein [Cyclobacteriaceae bacterium]